MQYTIRNIPKQVDRALRKRAKQQGKSLNQTALDALKEAVGVTDQPKRYRDLDFMAGTWVDEKAFDETRAYHERIDPDDWK